MKRSPVPTPRGRLAAIAIVLLALLGVLTLGRWVHDRPAPASDAPSLARLDSLASRSYPGVSPGMTDLERSRLRPLRLPPLPPPEPIPPPEPELPGVPPPPVETPPAEPELAAAPETAADSAPQADLPDLPEAAARSTSPRLKVYVHPRVPERFARRKVRGAALLQALVGPDGRVRDVRVLGAVPGCEECTRSVVEAVLAFEYEVVSTAAGPIEAWTEPFEIRFDSRR